MGTRRQWSARELIDLVLDEGSYESWDEPVDISGQPVDNVAVEPREITVEIDVQAVETNRTVSVRPRIIGTPAPGFALAAIDVEPSTATVRGLPDVLTGIDEVLTEELDIGGMSQSQEVELDLILPEEARFLEPESGVVTVTVTIEPSVSSRTFVVGIICEGAGDNACLPGIEQAAITLSGPAAAFIGVSAADLTPVVDVAGLTPGSYSLQPAISGLPDGVTLVSVSPDSIPVTIVAPATPAPSPTPEP